MGSKRAAKAKRVRRRREGRRGSFGSENAAITGSTCVSTVMSMSGLSGGLQDYLTDDVDDSSSATGSSRSATGSSSATYDAASSTTGSGNRREDSGITKQTALMRRGAFNSSMEQIRSMKYYDDMCEPTSRTQPHSPLFEESSCVKTKSHARSVIDSLSTELSISLRCAGRSSSSSRR